MKTGSVIGINLGRQDRAPRHQRAPIWSARRFVSRFCAILIVLTCGIVASAQQTHRTATGYQRTLNLNACGYGIGQCDEALLSPAEAAQVRAVRHQMNVRACGYGFGQCNEALLSQNETAQVSAVRHQMNVRACGYGFGQCDEALLSPAEAAQVRAVRHQMNVRACGYGFGQCDEGLLSPSEAEALKSTRARQEGFVTSHRLTSMGETSVAPPTPLDTQLNSLVKTLLTPVGSSIAEDGSYYGEPNKNGVPKTVPVHGYTRSNGTYVQGYYRSAPGTNPAR